MASSLPRGQGVGEVPALGSPAPPRATQGAQREASLATFLARRTPPFLPSFPSSPHCSPHPFLPKLLTLHFLSGLCRPPLPTRTEEVKAGWGGSLELPHWAQLGSPPPWSPRYLLYPLSTAGRWLPCLWGLRLQGPHTLSGPAWTAA